MCPRSLKSGRSDAMQHNLAENGFTALLVSDHTACQRSGGWEHMPGRSVSFAAPFAFSAPRLNPGSNFRKTPAPLFFVHPNSSIVCLLATRDGVQRVSPLSSRRFYLYRR